MAPAGAGLRRRAFVRGEPTSLTAADRRLSLVSIGAAFDPRDHVGGRGAYNCAPTSYTAAKRIDDFLRIMNIAASPAASRPLSLGLCEKAESSLLSSR